VQTTTETIFQTSASLS